MEEAICMHKLYRSYMHARLWKAIVDKNPIFSYSTYKYINSDINFSSSFTSTLNGPIHYTKLLFMFHFNSQSSNSFVQIPVQFSLQLPIVQFNSPNSCSSFTSTLNSPIYLSKFLFNFHFNCQ